MNSDQFARAAGRLAGRWLPVAKSAARSAAKAVEKHPARGLADQWIPAARQSGKFVRHVVPAAVKPLHALWHQVIGFIFLVFAGLGAWKVWRNQDAIALPVLIAAVIFIAVMAGYGISSMLKAQRITRS